MKSIHYGGLLILISGLLLISCTNTGTASTTPTLSVNPTAGLNSVTKSVTLTPALVPTALPTRIPTATVTRTATPEPTLAPEQAQAVVLDLLRTNGSCELPCWWGIVPGHTPWAEAVGLLEPIASRIAQYGQSHGAPDKVSVYFLTLPNEVASPYLQLDFGMRAGTVEQVQVSGFELPDYHLPQLLAKYGQPTEVWIHTEGFTPESNRSFVVALFYPDIDVLATYSTLGELVGDTVRGCFERSPSLRLWSGNRMLAFPEAAELFGWDVRSTLYLPLHDAVGMSAEVFYQSFQGAEKVCLQTAVDQWP